MLKLRCLRSNSDLPCFQALGSTEDTNHLPTGLDMTDPRNIAHDKKVQQAKAHRAEEIAPGSDKTPQPGKKTHMEHHASDTEKVPDEAAPVPTEKKSLG